MISGGLSQSGIPDAIGRKIYHYSGAASTGCLFFVMAAETLVSAFMNNVAATAMFLPGCDRAGAKGQSQPVQAVDPSCVRIHARRHLHTDRDIHQHGGQRAAAGIQNTAVRFFEYTPIGLAIALVGSCFVLLTSKFLLPDYPVDDLETVREYVARRSSCPLRP